MPTMDLALIDSILESVRNCLRLESGFQKNNLGDCIEKGKGRVKKRCV